MLIPEHMNNKRRNTAGVDSKHRVRVKGGSSRQHPEAIEQHPTRTNRMTCDNSEICTTLAGSYQSTCAVAAGSFSSGELDSSTPPQHGGPLAERLVETYLLHSFGYFMLHSSSLISFTLAL
jgi:hypothetical protein